MISIERIMVPTDFSDCSQLASLYAAEFAKRFEAEFHLLHVVAPVTVPVYMGYVPEELLEPEKGAKKALEDWDDPAFHEAKKVVRAVVLGTPFVEIVRYAKDHDCDLIVAGTHGRTGLSHALMGSVAEKVVRKSPCPVLTVRPEGHQFVMP